MAQIIIIDFETYFSTEYSLTRLTTEEYVRNEQFQTLCLGVMPWGKPKEGFVIEGPTRIKEWIKQQDWASTVVICHNAQFDCFILSHAYGVKPRSIICTLAMAHAVHGTLVPASLGAIAERYGLDTKTVPYNTFRGKRWEDLDGNLIRELSAGCLHDVELTHTIAHKLLKIFPKQELLIVDLTTRMYTEPMIQGDSALWYSIAEEEAARKNEALIELGVTEAQLQSTAKLKMLLEECGEDVPNKPGKNGPIPCVAATDEYLQELATQDGRAGALARTRIDVRSTITESRAGRLAGMAARGPLPVSLKYFGACTSRWSGSGSSNLQNLPRKGRLRSGLVAPPGHKFVIVDFCIAEGELVLTRQGPKAIQDVLISDQIWDGVEYVTHDGVIYKGEKEVITYQGLTATPDHIVYTRSGNVEKKYELSVAAGMGIKISNSYPTPPIFETTMLRSKMFWLQTLRGAGNKVFIPQCERQCYLGMGKSTNGVLQRIRNRSYKQQWSLRTGQFKTFDTTRKCLQSFYNYLCDNEWQTYCPNGFYETTSRMSLRFRSYRIFSKNGVNGGADITKEKGKSQRAYKQNSQRTHRTGEGIQTKKVYDIINCGPRNRFMVSNVVVSNCQIEYRILCALAGQTDKLDALAKGRNLYCEFGSTLFDRVITKEDKDEYLFSKKIVLGCGYGTGKNKAEKTAKAEGFNFTKDTTDRAIDLYRQTHPGVVKLWKRCDNILRSIGNGREPESEDTEGIPVKFIANTIVLPNGLWYTPELIWNNNERSWFRRTHRGGNPIAATTEEFLKSGLTKYWGGGLTEWLCQALARVCLSDLILRVYNNGLGVRPCLLVHDEWVGIVPEKVAKKYLERIISIASETPTWWLDGPPFKAEGRVVERYGE